MLQKKIFSFGVIKRSLLVLCLIVITAGCETIEDAIDGTFLGDKGSKPLPGNRVSILLDQSSIKPDPKAKNHNIILPAPIPNRDWPQAGGYANHAMHHMRISNNMKEKWQISIGEGNNKEDLLISQPIVAQNHIFTMDTETTVKAFSLNTGDELWSKAVTPKYEEDTHINGGLAYENGKIFVTTGFGHVVAINASSGKILWRRNIGASIRTAPSVRDGRVFAVTITNKLFAINGKDGNILWTHSGIKETTSILGGGSPAIDGGVVVAPYSSGELVALKVENGQKLWSDSLASGQSDIGRTKMSSIRGRPIIDRGIVFAVSNSGQLLAISLRMGRRIWERSIGSTESPWVAGNYLFLISDNNDLIALSRKNGRVFWVTSLPKWEDPEDRTGKIVWAGPILASDRLIMAGSNGEALSASPYSGKILGKQKMSDSVTISPVIAQNTLILLSNDAELSAYR